MHFSLSVVPQVPCVHAHARPLLIREEKIVIPTYDISRIIGIGRQIMIAVILSRAQVPWSVSHSVVKAHPGEPNSQES